MTVAKATAEPYARSLGLLRRFLLLLLLRHLRGAELLLLRAVLRHALRVVLLQLLGYHHLRPSLALEIALPLQHGRGDQALDPGCLLLLLALELAANHELAHIVLLLEVEELPNVGSTLRAQAARLVVVSQARDLLRPLLRDDEAEDGEIGPHDAAAHGL